MSQLVTSREEVKPLRPRWGRLWSQHETARLHQLYAAGIDHQTMAQELRRSVDGVMAKLGRMGLSAGAKRKPPAVRPLERSAKIVAHHYGVSVDELRSGEGQTRDLVCHRSVTAWLACRLGASSPRVGRYLKRDHSSILISCKRVERWRAADTAFKSLTDNMLAELQGGAR